jgi:hypothetical protein
MEAIMDEAHIIEQAGREKAGGVGRHHQSVRSGSEAAMTDLPALREAVAEFGRWQNSEGKGYESLVDTACGVFDVLPALLDELEAERTENTRLSEAFITMERAANQREAENARLRREDERVVAELARTLAVLSEVADPVAGVRILGPNEHLADLAKRRMDERDEARSEAHRNFHLSTGTLVDEALSKREQAEADLAALRARHAKGVEQAWREAALMVIDCPFTSEDIDKAWLESSAKAALEGKL